jgi:hypothetical protein
VDPERGLRQWPSAGTAWLVITVLLLVLSFGSPPVQRPVSASAPGADAAPSKPEPAASPEPAPPAIDPEAPAQPEAVQQPPPRPAPEPAASPEPALPAVEPEARTVPAVSEPSPAPQSTQAPAPAAARPPEAPVEAMAPPIPAGTDALCDPDEPFVFAHPEIAGPLRLTHCEPGPDGPARLPGPPLTNALIERVQRHLQDLGFDPGPADGLIGPRTRDAVRRFERDQGDEPTGAIDFRLLEQIRAAAATASEGRE